MVDVNNYLIVWIWIWKLDDEKGTKVGLAHDER